MDDDARYQAIQFCRLVAEHATDGVFGHSHDRLQAEAMRIMALLRGDADAQPREPPTDG